MFKKTITNLVLASLLIFSFSIYTSAQTDNNLSEQVKESDQKQESFQNELDKLFPTETDLFGEEKDNFAQGDLEQDVIPRVLRLMIILSGTAITLIFTYMGFRLVLARDDEAALTNLKNTFTQVVVGTILILSAFAIVVGIIEFFDALR